MARKSKKRTGRRLGWDDDEVGLNPAWAAVQRHAEAGGPRCRREYDQAADLLRSYRRGGARCDLTPRTDPHAPLERALLLAFGGSCAQSEKLYRRVLARCHRA